MLSLIAIILAVLCIFGVIILGRIQYKKRNAFNKTNEDERTKEDVGKKIKIDKDKVVSFKTNARWSSAKDWVVGIVAVVVIGFVFMYFHDKKDNDKATTKMKVLVLNTGQQTEIWQDPRYYYTWYPDGDVVFESIGRPGGITIDTLRKYSTGEMGWANTHHDGWHHWKLTPIATNGNTTLQVDSVLQ